MWRRRVNVAAARDRVRRSARSGIGDRSFVEGEEVCDGFAHLGAKGVRRTDAGRATGSTCTGVEVLSGALEQYICRLEESLAETDPSGGHVEQVDRRQLGMRRAHLH